MYLKKYGAKDEKFKAKVKEIQNFYKSKASILSFLDVPFNWLIAFSHYNLISQISKKFWLVEDLQKLSDDDLLKPYLKAVWEIDKLKKSSTPREKLTCFLMMNSHMKSAVVDFHRGKFELVSMDDQLPLIIFILVFTETENLISDICFVEDFTDLDSALESEKRLITNIKVNLAIWTNRDIMGY